ncbi:MAG: winged helix-turn-helix domain-containing protein [Sulfuricella sp.]|nr:winged helix-turn-helix domain-containing protein [Sulfuricella sp.]
MRLLLVEDDSLLGDGIRAGLRLAGHTVDWVKDGVAAQLALAAEEYSLVVLDLGLPRLSGLDLLRWLRQSGATLPVLILTARDSVADRVEGLDSGADDYLVKPFDLEELAARVRSLLRRSSGRASPLLKHGEITLDPAAHRVTRLDQPVELSPREFAILQQLLESAGRALSREQLEQSLYGWNEEVESNAVEVHIHHLRKKLGAELIRTVRGVGYMIDKSDPDHG